MINYFRQLRQIIRLGRLDAPYYLHPTAHVCRYSRLAFPCHVGSGARLKKTQLAAYSYVSANSKLSDCDIGLYTSIGPECIVGGLGGHPTDHYSTSPLTFSPQNPVSRLLGSTGVDTHFQELGRVSIGPDVWLGARVLVANGVTIGTGAIIGANTFVGKNVPPYAIFYGSPPKVHRYRFDEQTITRLLETKWWTSAPDKIDTQILDEILHDAPHNR